MNYIEQLKNGNKLHIKFSTIQKDCFMNSWIEEIWEYIEKKFKITYIGCEFTSEHKEEEIEQLLRDYEKENAVIEVINKDGIRSDSDEEYELYLKLKQKYEPN